MAKGGEKSMEETQQTTQPTESKKPGNPVALVAIIVLLLAAGGVYAVMQKSSVAKQESVVEGAKTAKSVVTVAPTLAPTSTASAEKTFTIVGQNYSFSPNQISVKKGDKVKITFSDEGGFHNLAIDGYNEKTETIRTGSSSVIEFTADKAGTFAFYCSVANHREQGMQGQLVVTE